jgi:hypothetical protein
MFLSSVLKAGDFLVPVPVGLPMTLQYNFVGNLEKIYLRHGNDRVEVTEELLDTFRKNHTVPHSLHVKKGITTIRGLLYTGEMMFDAGHLPYCVEDSLKAKFLAKPSSFNFFAITWESSEAVITGPTAHKQMLTMSKFRLLPGWLVPATMSQKILESWTHYPSYSFNPDMITNYVIFRDEKVLYFVTQMKQFVCSKVQKYTDKNGFIKARVFLREPIDKQFPDYLSVDYSEIIKRDMQPDTLVVLDSNNQILLTKPITSKTRQKMTNKLGCSFCNKAFTVPIDGEVMCPDIHCTSRLIPHVEQFLKVMKLPIPSAEIIGEWITGGHIFSIPDIFNMDDYAIDKVQLEITLGTLLRSLVPYSYIPREEVLHMFANNCTNNVDMFLHYCEHPESAVSDLKIVHKDFGKLAEWLNDNYNLSDIQTLLNIPQIEIKQTDKKFEGAPIFRGKSIYITGEFVRGPQHDIAAILTSYAAKVLPSFEDIADCVIVGGLLENINAENVNRARTLGISIFEEDDFFQKYEIDEDLKTNL